MTHAKCLLKENLISQAGELSGNLVVCLSLKGVSTFSGTWHKSPKNFPNRMAGNCQASTCQNADDPKTEVFPASLHANLKSAPSQKSREPPQLRWVPQIRCQVDSGSRLHRLALSGPVCELLATDPPAIGFCSKDRGPAVWRRTHSTTTG